MPGRVEARLWKEDYGLLMSSRSKVWEPSVPTRICMSRMSGNAGSDVMSTRTEPSCCSLAETEKLPCSLNSTPGKHVLRTRGMISGACEKHCMTRASCPSEWVMPRTRPMISVKCGFSDVFSSSEMLNGLVAKSFPLRSSNCMTVFLPRRRKSVTRPYAVSSSMPLRDPIPVATEMSFREICAWGRVKAMSFLGLRPKLLLFISAASITG